MSKILITGGAGYIGSMLCTKLLEAGYIVTVVDLLKYDKGSLNHLYFHKNFKLICEDIRKVGLMKKLVKQHDYIIPLAALVGAPLCEKFKKEALSTNLGSIKTLCNIATKKNKVIYLTTNSGYGIGEKNKYCDENSPLKPISLYGRTKCDGEDLVKKKIKNYVCYRLATVFGHSYRMRSDLLVNNFVHTAIQKKKLTLFEPHFRRNFIHVRDVVNAIIFTIKNFNRLKSNVYNLGLSSANISKIMLAKKIQKQYKNLKIKIVTNRKDPDKRDYFVSNKKIEKKGFKAKISLENGISELIQIFTNDKNKVINNY
jgi:nucleoside-diphosphate-sugar epimerase